MFKELWNQLQQEAVTSWKITHFQQVKYAMNYTSMHERRHASWRSNTENYQKFMRRATHTAAKQKLYKMKQNGILVNMDRP